MRRFLRSDEGFTIVELMMVSVLSLIILFSAFALLDSATKTERGAQARFDAALGVRQAMLQTTTSRATLSADRNFTVGPSTRGSFNITARTAKTVATMR